MSITIIPSLLEPSESAFEARLRLIEQFAPIGQLDVLDSSYVSYRSFHDPEVIDRLVPKIPLEVHLMTEPTIETISLWNRPWVDKIIFHLKAVEDPNAIISAIKQMGKKVGLALSPDTSLLEAKPFIHSVDTVLIMGVQPGRSGQEIIPSSVEKVKRLRKLTTSVNVEFDGGVNEETIHQVIKAGANLIVVGSFLANQMFEERYNQLIAHTNVKEARATEI